MKDSVYTQLTEYITGNQNKFYRLAYSYLNNKEAAQMIEEKSKAYLKEDDNMVSFVLYGAESWVSAYDFNIFYNINLSTDTEITLEELLGKDYIQRANTGIREQMAERVKENSDNMYFKADEGGFQTIDQNMLPFSRQFYLPAEREHISC